MMLSCKKNCVLNLIQVSIKLDGSGGIHNAITRHVITLKDEWAMQKFDQVKFICRRHFSAQQDRDIREEPGEFLFTSSFKGTCHACESNYYTLGKGEVTVRQYVTKNIQKVIKV